MLPVLKNSDGRPEIVAIFGAQNTASFGPINFRSDAPRLKKKFGWTTRELVAIFGAQNTASFGLINFISQKLRRKNSTIKFFRQFTSIFSETHITDIGI